MGLLKWSSSLGELRKRLDARIDQLPDVLGAEAVNFSLERFREENWHDRVKIGWRERARNRDPDRGLLVQSGNLRDSIQYRRTGKLSVVIFSGLDYAKAHNEGVQGTMQVRSHYRMYRDRTRVKVRAHTREANLPQRQFVGESDALNRRLVKRMVRFLFG